MLNGIEGVLPGVPDRRPRPRLPTASARSTRAGPSAPAGCSTSGCSTTRRSSPCPPARRQRAARPRVRDAFAVAREAGRLDDPRARDLIGEARMLELVGERAQTRASARASRTRTMSDQAAGHRPALRRHERATARPPSRSSSPAPPARRGPTTTATLGDMRHRLPDAPDRLHRRRHHRDGPQRHQRAGARHATASARSTATSPFRDVPAEPRQPLGRLVALEGDAVHHAACGRGSRSRGCAGRSGCPTARASRPPSGSGR